MTSWEKEYERDERAMKEAAIAEASAKIGLYDWARTNAYMVWPFRDAPTFLQALSVNGGDEDWVVLIPLGLGDPLPAWIEFTDSMRDPIRYTLTTGHVVYIGAHS